jgi:hypothetical protein
MTSKRPTNGTKTAVPNTNPSHPITENSCLKFTYSIKSDKESLTIRTDSEAELEELIGRWKHRIISKAKPKMNDGDKCLECEGFMTQQLGTNRTTGKQYYYLSCSNFPKCSASAYLAPTTQQTA